MVPLRTVSSEEIKAYVPQDLWRTTLEKQQTTALAQINNFDAFLVIWEMKT